MVELNAIHGRRFARAGDEYHLGSDLFMDGQSRVDSIALTGKAHVHEHKLRSMLYGQCDGPLRRGGNADYRHAHVLSIGRASCRARVWQYVLLPVVAGALKKK